MLLYLQVLLSILILKQTGKINANVILPVTYHQRLPLNFTGEIVRMLVTGKSYYLF